MAKRFAVVLCLLAGLPSAFAQTKGPITLDEFMGATELKQAKLSADGTAAVLATNSPDYQHHRFADDLWLWKESAGQVVPLTHSGHARAPQWSPDGKHIAFLSDSPLPDDEKDPPERVWLIAVNAGEAFPLYLEKLEAHGFAWSPDGSRIFFSCAVPLSKSAEEDHKARWKDVIRWREQERGDLLLALPATSKDTYLGSRDTPLKPKEGLNGPPIPGIGDDALPLPPPAKRITAVEDEITEIAPNGNQIAFVTDSVSHRLEDPRHGEIYLVSSAGGEARRLTVNDAREASLLWSHDGSRIFFHVGGDEGALEGPFQSTQGRLYAIDPASGKVTRLGGSFEGSFEGFTLMDDGRLMATGLKGTQQQLYTVAGDQATLLPALPGSYAGVDAGPRSHRLLVKYSRLAQPTQLFVAEDASHLEQAKAITRFNQVFNDRAKPEWKPYRWKAEDGATVEGMLIYPPNRMGETHMRMLTLIHGGPADADGDRFGADWYDWASLAAARGWLVFRPNYRGSSGYGDRFMREIAPHLVSRPGKDILQGIDALVKDGIADRDRLTIGGYSYGGYMTDWLITQTTEFKAAVTGAGAIEHAANWGNDDTSYDDEWYLGGALPWQNPGLYQSEAALYQMDKVKTPTHIVGGDADVRVSYLEDVLLERVLQRLQVPHSLLVFPGEGHGLDKDPWHGYIKVREELDWLEKYGVTQSK